MGIFVNRDSTSYHTYFSSKLSGVCSFNIDGNGSVSSILDSFWHNGFKSLAITFAAFYVCVPTCEIMDQNFMFSVILFSELNLWVFAVAYNLPGWLKTGFISL